MTIHGGLRPFRAVRTQLARSVAVVAAVGLFSGLVGGVIAPTSAQAATLPRFLPTQVPEGFKIALALDAPARSNETYLGVVRNAENTQEFMITGTPSSEEDGAYFASIAKKSEPKVKVHGKPALLSEEGGEVQLRWFEKNALVTISGFGVSRKATLGFAANVLPSKKKSGSFSIKKVPVNFSKIFVGPVSSLISDSYAVYYESSGGELLAFSGANVATNYLEVFGGPSSALQPTTVNSKPAFSTSLGVSGVVWMEQPNLLLQVFSTDMNVAGVMEVANSVKPIDEAAYQAAIEVAETNSSSDSTASNPGEQSGPVAAGTIAGAPWVATIQGQCVKFAIGKSTTEACVTGFLSPSALIGSVTTVNSKPVAVGVTGANVVTVVLTANGAEVARAATQPVLDQPGLRYFITEVSVPEGVTAIGLDAAGKEIAPSTPLKKA